jgi:protein TonB
MAYVDKQPLSHRLANLGTAGLIELGVGVALIAGLSTTFVPDPPVPQITARNIDDDLPPPPPPDDQQPQPRPHDSVIDAPLPPPDMPTAGPDIGTADDAFPWPDDRTVDFPTPQPSAKPSPTYSPIAAAPRNDPAGWVTTEDYPSRDLREGNQGTTQFRLIVGSNGRVQACEILRSSGFASLDKVTCDKVSRRARFDPATDQSGAKVVGSYVSSVKWRIPPGR